MGCFAPMIDRATVLKRSDERDANGQRGRFSIRFVTRNAKRKDRVSKHIHFPVAERCGASHSLIMHDQISVRPVGTEGHPVHVHVALITHYNEEPVI